MLIHRVEIEDAISPLEGIETDQQLVTVRIFCDAISPLEGIETI